LIIAVSSLYGIWYIPIGGIITQIIGLLISGNGTTMLLAGMIEFHSVCKISGMDSSKLVTTGIYKWSRNPQFLGLYLALIGVSLTGQSGYALLVTAMIIVLSHYYIIRIEEPYLERIFGEEYIKYKSKTPRYILKLKKK